MLSRQGAQKELSVYFTLIHITLHVSYTLGVLLLITRPIRT